MHPQRQTAKFSYFIEVQWKVKVALSCFSDWIPQMALRPDLDLDLVREKGFCLQFWNAFLDLTRGVELDL